MNHRRAYVFFHAAVPQPWGRSLRMCLRKPGSGWKAVRRRIVQQVSDADLYHTAVGDGQVVLDPAHDGNLFLPQDPYAAKAPHLILVFEVPLARSMRLGAFKNRPGEVWWRVVMKFLTGGRFATRDCVDTVREALANGGVQVPRTVISPIQLKDWLYGQGHPHAILQ